MSAVPKSGTQSNWMEIKNPLLIRTALGSKAEARKPCGGLILINSSTDGMAGGSDGSTVWHRQYLLSNPETSILSPFSVPDMRQSVNPLESTWLLSGGEGATFPAKNRFRYDVITL